MTLFPVEYINKQLALLNIFSQILSFQIKFTDAIIF